MKISQWKKRDKQLQRGIEAVELFDSAPSYTALWALRAKLTEIFEAKDRFLWAALDREGRLLVTDSEHARTARRALEKGVADPIIWLVASTESYTDEDFGFALEAGPNGTVRMGQACPKCHAELPLRTGLCPDCGRVIDPRWIPGS